MTTKRMAVPSYRLHKASGRAVVTLNGHTHYLGEHGSEESRARYERLVAEWLANGRELPGPADGGVLSVNRLVLSYLRHCEIYYRKPDGRPTKERRSIASACRPLCELFGRTPAAEFGPKRLKLVRESMIQKGWARRNINLNIGRIRRLFKWAASEELVPGEVFHGLQSVAGLKPGRSKARETTPIPPVEESVMRATLPHVSRQVAAMIKLQWLTGMRPGEVVQLRTSDVDRSAKVWIYRPRSHKTEHHGKTREIALGPKAQVVLQPFLKLDRQAFCFSPREAKEEEWAGRRACRKTPMTPSQRARQRVVSPKRAPGDAYTTQSYGRAIRDACARVEIPHWAPNQLRHAAATRIAREKGLEVARAVLGHSSAVTTEIYAEMDTELSARTMGELG